MLPTTRNRTYLAGDPINANDLNDFQDQIIGRKFPRHWRPVPMLAGPLDHDMTYAASHFVAGPVSPTVGAWNPSAPILIPGETIYKVRAIVTFGQPTNSFHVKFANNGVLAPNVVTITIDSHAIAIRTVVESADVAHQVQADGSYFFNTTLVGLTVYRLEVLVGNE